MNDNSREAAKVLLLDDNLMTSSRVASALRTRGCEVVVSRAAPNEGAFDYVLLNLGSRSLNGVELLPGLRTRFEGAQLFGFCGHLEIEIRRTAKEAGIDRLLTNESVTALQWLDD